MADVVVPRAYLENFTNTLTQLDEFGRRVLADALARADLSNRSRVAAIMRVHCNASAEAAGELAAQFYRGMSLIETGEDFQGMSLPGLTDDELDDATYAIYRVSEDDSELVRRLLNQHSYIVNRSAKHSTWANGQIDPRDVRYARVPMGERTCAWCLALAGLGFHYMSEESASHTHAGCDCKVVPVIGEGSVSVEEYEPEDYADVWRDATQRLRDGDVPQELRDRIDHAKRLHSSRTSEPWTPFNEQLIAMRYFNHMDS